MAIRGAFQGFNMKDGEKALRAMLIGFHKSWFITWVLMFCLSLSLFAQGSNDYDLESLNNFAHDYATKFLANPRTGTLYSISLPANFSGIEVSVVRLRSGQVWAKGENFSFFQIPPRIMPTPYAIRIAIMYQNLGNWSSYYFKVPGYKLVAPVVGFVAYDSSNSSTIGNRKVNFSIMGEPISVHFPLIDQREGKNTTPKCVKFGADGSFTLRNMNKSHVCVTEGQGHFSVVVPKTRGEGRIRFWVLGFSLGFVGLVFMGLIMAAIFRRKKMRGMEKQTERGVAFDTFCIGWSKMPSASMVRTQPALENDYVP